MNSGPAQLNGERKIHKFSPICKLLLLLLFIFYGRHLGAVEWVCCFRRNYAIHTRHSGTICVPLACTKSGQLVWKQRHNNAQTTMPHWSPQYFA